VDEGKRFGEAGVGGLVIEANVPKSRICCDLFVAPTNVYCRRHDVSHPDTKSARTTYVSEAV